MLPGASFRPRNIWTYVHMYAHASQGCLRTLQAGCTFFVPFIPSRAGDSRVRRWEEQRGVV